MGHRSILHPLNEAYVACMAVRVDGLFRNNKVMDIDSGVCGFGHDLAAGLSGQELSVWGEPAPRPASAGLMQLCAPARAKLKPYIETCV